MTARRARIRRHDKTVNRLLRQWLRSLHHLPDYGASVPLPIHLHLRGCTIHPHGTYQLCRWDTEPDTPPEASA